MTENRREGLSTYTTNKIQFLTETEQDIYGYTNLANNT